MAMRSPPGSAIGARGPSLALLACLFFLVAPGAQAREWVVGKGYQPWDEPVERWIALDDSTVPGAIQPRQIKPGENILRTGPPNPNVKGIANIFGYPWSFRRGPLYMALEDLETGWNPRLWSAGSATAAGNPSLIDGVEDVPAFFGEAPITGRPNADDWHTLDLAIPVPIDSVAFFPPQKGLHPTLGQLYKDLFPKGYAVSRATTPVGWLLDDEEPKDTGRSSSYHPLEEVIAQTFSNPRSVVGLHFPLRFTRFLRFYFGGVAQTFAIAELKAFGRGFPAETRYISRPIAISNGTPVGFGRISWQLTAYRLHADGSIVADPAAPVRLRLHTRTGLDDQPEVYHIYDELGRQQVVDRDTYLAAPSPRTTWQKTAAGYRGAVTEDAENWDLWSSPYERSGEEIRSSDARSYLQFRFSLETDEPLTFARLDSIAIEYSSLLAANAFGEVSLQDREEAVGAAILTAGVDTVFIYDLKAVFDAADQQGFDGIRLDVPPGTRFLGLEMGSPFIDVAPDSVDTSASDQLQVFFPSQRITRDNNQPLRLRLRGTIFQASVFFTGFIFDTQSDGLPQTITPGDANPEVFSNTIQMRSSGSRLQMLKSVAVQPRAITPNGDLVNDRLQVGFGLFGVEQAIVSIQIFDLAGHRVARLQVGPRKAGNYLESWDGRDDAGELVRPGIYLVRLEVEVDRGTYEETHPVTVVY